jgi:VanZ family protein
VALWCAAIFAVSGIPDAGGAPSELPELMFRKTAHLVEYGILALLAGRALAGMGGGPRRVLWGSFLFCALYAVSDEVHQSFVPGRFGKVRDVALDSLGAALALSVDARWRDRRLKARSATVSNPLSPAPLS